MIKILKNKIEYANIINFNEIKSSKFLSKTSDSFQIGYFNCNTPKKVLAHKHIKTKKTINDTYEIIYILMGSCEVTFFDKNDKKICSHTVKKNSAVVTKFGGHSYKFFKNCRFIEIKQGPYYGEKKDKIYL